MKKRIRIHHFSGKGHGINDDFKKESGGNEGGGNENFGNDNPETGQANSPAMTQQNLQADRSETIERTSFQNRSTQSHSTQGRSPQSQSLQGKPTEPETTQLATSGFVPGSSYVHDPESLYNAIGQDQFVRSLIGMRLHSLSFPAFSRLIRQLLLRSGYSSVRSCGEGTNRKTWGEGGLELLAFAHTDLSTSLTAIQLKQHREPIPRRCVDELRGVVDRIQTDTGLIIATSVFSGQAREAASDKHKPPVRLIDGKELTGMLVERGLGLRTVRQVNGQGDGQSDGQSVRQIFDAEFFDALETPGEEAVNFEGEARAGREVSAVGSSPQSMRVGDEPAIDVAP